MDFDALAYYNIIHDFFVIYKEFAEISPFSFSRTRNLWFKPKKLSVPSHSIGGLCKKYVHFY